MGFDQVIFINQLPFGRASNNPSRTSVISEKKFNRKFYISLTEVHIVVYSERLIITLVVFSKEKRVITLECK
jgi:hypothetical protein